MSISRCLKSAVFLSAILATTATWAVQVSLTIKGSDAIWLAGRTDLTIPPASDPWPGGMLRHGGATPEEILETLPPIVTVSAGDVVRALDPAVGGVSFFNGFGGTIYGPEGNGAPNSSSISSFGGISGYIGTQGALVGVFLDNDIPDGTAPATLNFSNAGFGVEFTALSPGLGQVFYIGNGQNTGGVFHAYTAPTGATRLALGITDAFGFNGAPGAFDDNDGSYGIRIGINEIPTTGVPDTGSTALFLGAGFLGLAAIRRRMGRN